jgi:hypothetical protein
VLYFGNTTLEYSHNFIILISLFNVIMDFGSKKQAAQPEQQGFDQAKLYLWVKALEGKVNNLLREVDMIKNDFIKRTNDLKKEMKDTSADLLEFRHDHEKTIEKMDLIVKELKQTAGIEEVKTLKKYMELWNPMTFVTQKDLERMVEQKLNKPEKVKLVPKDETHSPFN